MSISLYSLYFSQNSVVAATWPIRDDIMYITSKRMLLRGNRQSYACMLLITAFTSVDRYGSTDVLEKRPEPSAAPNAGIDSKIISFYAIECTYACVYYYTASGNGKRFSRRNKTYLCSVQYSVREIFKLLKVVRYFRLKCPAASRGM